MSYLTAKDFSYSDPQKHWELVRIPRVRGVEHLVVYDTGKYLELELLHVKPECQGQGIGTRQVERIQKLGRPIHLIVDASPGKLRRLKKFYSRLGFRSVGANTMLWLPAYHKSRP